MRFSQGIAESHGQYDLGMKGLPSLQDWNVFHQGAIHVLLPIDEHGLEGTRDGHGSS